MELGLNEAGGNSERENAKKNTLYTIGYHPFRPDEMIRLLRNRGIGALIDVRAWPRSRRYHLFDDVNFGPLLRSHGIYHLCMGKELGVRPSNPALYTSGNADYEKIAGEAGFRKDLGRIRRGLDKFPVCLMCKEADPAECHRAILICREFSKLFPEYPVCHILEDESVISQKDIDRQLLPAAASNWLMPKMYERELEEAYRRRGRKIAWKIPGDMLARPWENFSANMDRIKTGQ